MRTLLLFLFSLPMLAQAHCPYEVSYSNEAYCLDLEWDFGERKIKGEFKPTNTVTPYLIPHKEIPQRWIYSTAYLIVWKKGDKNHKPVEIPNFRVFPYMHMENGHHHSAGYDFLYDEAEEAYLFRRVAFQQMKGCWSLRWTTADKDLMASSKELLQITEFTNIDEQQKEKMVSFCRTNNSESEHSQHHGHNHAHH